LGGRQKENGSKLEGLILSDLWPYDGRMPRHTAQPGAKERTAARRLKALELRKMGMSYRAIADRLSINGETPVSFVQIFKDVRRANRETLLASKQTCDELVALERARLDMARLSIAADVAKGKLGAIDRWLKISERESKLMGLDKPFKFEDATPPTTRRLRNLTVAELQLFEALLQKVEQPLFEIEEEEMPF